MPPRSAAASPAPVSGVACHTGWNRQSRDRRRKAQTRERYDVIWEQKPGALWRPAHLLLDVVPNGVRAVFLDVTTKADIQSRIILSSDYDGEPPVHRAQESPSAYLDVGTQSGTTRINDCDDSAGQTMYLASYDWTRNDWTGEFRLRLSARPSPALDLACSKSSVKLSFCCVTEEGSLIEGAMKRRIKELNREHKRAGECRWPAHRWTIGARCEVYCAARKNWNHGMVVALKSDVTGRPTIVVHYVQAHGGGMTSRTLLDNAFDLRAAETHVDPYSLRQSVVGGNILATKCLRTSFKVAAEKTVEGFHGTSLENALHILQFGFRPSRNGMLGRGVYWSDNVMKTITYASCDRSGRRRPMGWGVVLKLEIRAGHTKTIDHCYHPSRLTWNAEGYDTAWVPAFCGMVPSGLSENCTYDSSRVTVTGVSTNYGESFATGDRLECLAKLLAHDKHHRMQEWQADARRALARLNLNSKIERAALDAAACSVVCWLLPVVCGMALTLIGTWSLFSDIAVLSILIGSILLLVGLLGFCHWWGHSLRWLSWDRTTGDQVNPKFSFMMSICLYAASAMIHVTIYDQTTLDSERPIYPVGPAVTTLGLLGIMYAMCNEISAMGLTPLWLQRPLEFLGHHVPIVCWACMLLGGMLSHQIGQWSLFADYALWSGLICLPLCFVAAHGFDHCVSAARISIGWQEGDEGLLSFRLAFGFFFLCAWIPTLGSAFGFCPVMGSVPTLVVDDDGWVVTKWLLPQQIEQVRDKMSATAAPECTNTCKLYNASTDLNQTISPLVNNSVCQDGGHGDLSPADSSSSSRASVFERQCQLGADTVDCGCRDGKSVADWVPPPDLKREYGWLSRFDADGGSCGNFMMIWDGIVLFPLLLFVCWCMYKQIPIMRRARAGLCFPRCRADDMERSNSSRAESEASKRERSQYGAHANDAAGHAAGRTTRLVNPLIAADIETGQVAEETSQNVYSSH